MKKFLHGKQKKDSCPSPALPFRKGEKVLYYGMKATVVGIEKRLLTLVTPHERNPFPCDPSLVKKIQE